jgi:hypothetical protein
MSNFVVVEEVDGVLFDVSALVIVLDDHPGPMNGTRSAKLQRSITGISQQWNQKSHKISPEPLITWDISPFCCPDFSPV